jgi:hypothetical protein
MLRYHVGINGGGWMVMIISDDLKLALVMYMCTVAIEERYSFWNMEKVVLGYFLFLPEVR